jgi:DNA-binding transcriptional LysR family regulator
VLSIAFVPGVTLTKWTRAWDERDRGDRLQVTPTDDPVAAVREGRADLGFVRLPVAEDETVGLNLIRLYSEVPVAVLAKEHPLGRAGGIRRAELDGDTVLEVTATVKDAVELVAAGVGVLLVPQSVARLYNRKDVVAVPITDAPESTIGLVWLVENTNGHTGAAIDEFVGIVRGRSIRSSRGTPTPPAPRSTAPTTKQKPGTPTKRRPPRPTGGKRRRTW